MATTHDNAHERHILLKRFGYLAVGVAALMLVPLVAMQLTEEVNWGVFDFVAACALLSGTGAAWLLLARRFRSGSHRAMLAAGLAFALLLIWAELAVGIFH